MDESWYIRICNFIKLFEIIFRFNFIYIFL